jgi:transposase
MSRYWPIMPRGGSGRRISPGSKHRLLLRGRELSERALVRMWNGCVDHDPTGQILSAWIAKEELRAVCATAARGGHRHEIHKRLWAFYRWCAGADIPELTTLAETIEAWWPEVEVFLTTGITNARTEGTNRLIKQVKRAACGFRNRENYRRRVRLHCTRQTRRLSARKPTVPAQSGRSLNPLIRCPWSISRPEMRPAFCLSEGPTHPMVSSRSATMTTSTKPS